MAKEIEITDNSHIRLDDDSVVETRGTSSHPFYIRELQNIAPIAAHIKELNHIDPISVDSLHVTEVRNIEPINVARFNVTSLPMVNMSLRSLPPVSLDIRELPAISVGTHQIFEVPSDYMVRARLLGFEVLRLSLRGRTEIAPRDRYRREQSRSDNRSFAEVATAGNPAIPSRLEKRRDTYSGRPHGRPHHARHRPASHGSGLHCGHGRAAHSHVRSSPPHQSSINPGSAAGLSAGLGGRGFNISPSGPTAGGAGSSVSSGG